MAVSPDGRSVAFSGVIVDRLEGAPTTRLCMADAEQGGLRVASSGPNNDRLPKWSPDGRVVAFLSDRAAIGNFQLYLFDPVGTVMRTAPSVDGWVEYLHWSPGGASILLGVAAFGADLAGVHGGIPSRKNTGDPADWMPEIDPGGGGDGWRTLWRFDVQNGSVRRVSPPGLNVWEAVWWGEGAILAVCSTSPEEGAWYSATLRRIELSSGNVTQVHHPGDQIGWPSASPTGTRIAFVEAVSSDRWLVAGNLCVIEVATGERRSMDTHGVDVTFAQWQTDDHLLIAGVRSFETVVALLNITSGRVHELLVDPDRTCGERYPCISARQGVLDEVLLALEGYSRGPELCAWRNGVFRTLHRFTSSELTTRIAALGSVERVDWRAGDGLEIQGRLLRSDTPGPDPLVMMVHGGPVWQWRPRFLAKPPLYERALLERGYAVFLPEPRGSGGHGREFAARVRGDMGGEDASDCLSGLDELVRRGIADGKRLGTMGVSYGGFMSSWLVTQDRRFSAAVSISPVTDWVTEELTSHIGSFCRLFLSGDLHSPRSQHLSRSPIMFAHQCRTPVLNICGALDHNTPPGQALEFHRALQRHACESVLLTYPLEGHGCRNFPAHIDVTARATDWFVRHMPSRAGD